MDISELKDFKLSDAVVFHDDLNPNLWNGTRLDPKVRKQLMLIAEDFIITLGISDLHVKDITISGSNAAYSYTPHSDLDLHILVDMDKLPNNEVYRELFTAKKTLYNDQHNVSIRNVPVEVYVQDTNEPVNSLGEYSVVNDKWIKIPKKQRANFDQAATKAKYENLAELVDLAIKSADIDRVKKLIDMIRRYRKAGLSKGGEFSPENLAYKAVRSQGAIDALYALRNKLHSEELTIEEKRTDVTLVLPTVEPDHLAERLSKEFEDYDPNGKPPGPEFKPTMPAGTVRVDVSDVYDWYKLGQHISNMKGLGKHDFGQGPPSTILSFGDEDTEHKYIQDLEKTGLTTTDIDPVDPKQPKGMKRQKTDPAYNVDELAEYRSQEIIHTNPKINTLKSLARNNKYGSARFTIDKDDHLKAGDSVAFVHQDLEPAYGRVVIRGYINFHDGNYNYKTMGPYDNLPRDHPILRKFEKAGVENGNIDEDNLNEALDRDGAIQQILKIKNTSGRTQGEIESATNIINKLMKKFNIRPEEIDKPKDTKLAKKIAATQYEKQAASDALKAEWERFKRTIFPKKGLNEAFTTKQQVINYFLKIGKTADQGAAAWARGYRGPKPKETKPYPNNRLPYVDEDSIYDSTFNINEDEDRKAAVLKIQKHLNKKYGANLDLDGKLGPLTLKSINKFMPRAKTGLADEPDKTTAVQGKKLKEASGYIPSEQKKNDPRFKTALTVDVRPDAIKKNAKAFGFTTSRAGIPPQARADGKIK